MPPGERPATHEHPAQWQQRQGPADAVHRQIPDVHAVFLQEVEALFVNPHIGQIGRVQTAAEGHGDRGGREGCAVIDKGRVCAIDPDQKLTASRGKLNHVPVAAGLAGQHVRPSKGVRRGDRGDIPDAGRDCREQLLHRAANVGEDRQDRIINHDGRAANDAPAQNNAGCSGEEITQDSGPWRLVRVTRQRKVPVGHLAPGRGWEAGKLTAARLAFGRRGSHCWPSIACATSAWLTPSIVAAPATPYFLTMFIRFSSKTT